MQTALEHATLNLTPVVPALMTILYGAALLRPLAVLIKREPTPNPPVNPVIETAAIKSLSYHRTYFLKHEIPPNFTGSPLR